MRTTDEPGDQLRAPFMYNVVVPCSTGVPQLKASTEEVTDGEEGKPLGSDETL